ncbi:cyclase family protein [Actinoallomurus iriomotensis]|uniref:Cyclase n=1 Tax=Actinoallomurus iriomotensis TaxID=478107 RepID=A0A9W6VPY7_9ACTN|nr:cyclase family protein [Actinoallomurus iriomotensis]GLY76175.1 cyclase [Actinoallomurus iriomotensis]
MTPADFRRIGAAVSNWGRWGAEDERGTTNLITPQNIVEAARLVRKGAVFELGVPLDADGPPAFPGRIAPLHLMTETGAGQEYPGGARWSDDYVVMPLQAGTQWDAFAHVWYDGMLYNGFPEDTIGPHGARRCSIDALAGGVTGRGVLLDVARHSGVDWLEGGHVIGPETLDAVAERQGTEIRPGDILLVRTGWWGKFAAERDGAGWISTEPGLGLACVRWIRDHDLAALAMDNWGIEVAPGEDPAATNPVHCVLLRDVGIPLGEIFDLEALADDCADDGRYEFLFTAPPLKVAGAVGSPISPLALK